MTVSQDKIDLAVLYKLHQHAEAGGDAIPPAEVLRLFETDISLRRVELALEALEARQDVERKYDHFYLDEGAWQVSRDGMAKVDRALRVPASFVARLHEHGDTWLESDEARQAVLKKLEPDVASIPMIAPLSTSKIDYSEADSAVDWTKWGTILTALAILVSIMLWYVS